MVILIFTCLYNFQLQKGIYQNLLSRQRFLIVKSYNIERHIYIQHKQDSNIQNSKSKIQFYKPRTIYRNQKPETRSQEPKTTNLKQQTTNQNPETRIQNPKNLNPESKNQNPESKNQNPESRIQRSSPTSKETLFQAIASNRPL